MQVTLRGVRGSIPVPGQSTQKYGGNTTCIDIVTDEGDQIIIDAGTGIRELGMLQMDKLPVNATIFLTHTHWDHIQGLPFYLPLFVPGNQIDIYGAFDPVYKKDLKSILSQQMEYCYFPVRECELNAGIAYHNIKEYEPIVVGSATVTPILLNHPVLNYGYKICSHGKSFFFTGDYEPAANIYDEDTDEEYAGYQELVDDLNACVVQFIDEVDVMVCDAQYTQQEYANKRGWGHGTYQSCLKLAQDAQVNQVHFTHHDPNRTDAQLDEIYGNILEQAKAHNASNTLYIAQEGTVIRL